MQADLHVGSVPVEEPCAQVGTDGYEYRAWHECRALIEQLRRMLGPEPPGSRLYIKSNPHDFGSYYSANFAYAGEDQASRAYAERLERELPTEWDEDAKSYLGEKLRPKKAKQKTPQKKGGAI